MFVLVLSRRLVNDSVLEIATEMLLLLINFGAPSTTHDCAVNLTFAIGLVPSSKLVSPTGTTIWLGLYCLYIAYLVLHSRHRIDTSCGFLPGLPRARLTTTKTFAPSGLPFHPTGLHVPDSLQGKFVAAKLIEAC